MDQPAYIDKDRRKHRVWQDRPYKCRSDQVSLSLKGKVTSNQSQLESDQKWHEPVADPGAGLIESFKR